MCKDWKKELEEYIARATKKQHISDNFYIAVGSPEFKAKRSIIQKNMPVSKERVAKASATNKGKIRSEKSRANISAGRKGIKLAPLSKSHKANLSKALKGRPAPNKGVPQSAESNAKRSAANMGISHPKVTCPHCGQEGGARHLKRYHFDNCKLKRD